VEKYNNKMNRKLNVKFDDMYDDSFVEYREDDSKRNLENQINAINS